ncbi:hypothetical protein Tco_1198047 [Tanacetum coccineum]
MLIMVNQKLLMMLKSSPDVNTGSLKLNVVGSSVNTTSSNEQESPKDMFTMGVSHTLEATHIEFFSDEHFPHTSTASHGDPWKKSPAHAPKNTYFKEEEDAPKSESS